MIESRFFFDLFLVDDFNGKKSVKKIKWPVPRLPGILLHKKDDLFFGVSFQHVLE